MSFKDDQRKTNPGLHLLYTKWAVGHLRMIDEAIERFSEQSNTNLDGVVLALQRERDTLTTDNAAYADADEIVGIYRNGITAPEVLEDHDGP